MNESNLIKADFNGNSVSFAGDGWFNATQAATVFGKTPNEWLRLPATVDYLKALNRKYGKIPYYKTKRGQGGGTWLHPKLAVRFSQWLDIDFAIWCDEQIDAILRGKLDQKKLRHESASGYKVMAAILLLDRQERGKDTKTHHYTNEARLINWAVTGKFQSLDRDSLTAKELDVLAKLQEKNSVLIGRGVDYDTRKKIIEQYAIDLRDHSLLAA